MNKKIWISVIILLASLVNISSPGFNHPALAGEQYQAIPPGAGSISETDVQLATYDQNVELLGHLGGPAQAIEVVGDYAYIGIGQEFAIFDISDPANVQRVGWLLAEGEVRDIAIQGDYAYLAYHDQNAREPGLQVVDIHNPAVPVSLVVKEFGDCGFMERVVVQGDSAYFAFDACEAFGGIIMSTGASIYRLDVTYPASPVIIDKFGEVLGDIYGLASSSGWLYALIYYWTQPILEQNRMVVLDISPPESMVETASITSLGSHIALAGDYALIAADNGLQVVDVSNPTQPNDIGFHNLPAGITGVFTEAATAYVTYPDKIYILDMTDPLNPVDLGIYQSSGGALDLSAQGGTAFSANGADGVESFDSATLSQIDLVEYPENPNDLVTDNGYSYLAADDGFWVLDASDLAAPFPIAHMETLSPTVSLALAGSFAFLASPDDGIPVIDVTDPYSPVEAAAFSLPLDLRQLVLVNNTLYVAAGRDGLHILDVSDPYQLEEIGAFTPYFGINAVAVAGGYAYLAASNDNLIVLDVSSPTSPKQIGVYDPPNDLMQAGSAVAILGDIALLGTITFAPTPLAGADWGNIWIIDVSNPEEPTEAGNIYSGAPYRIHLQDDHAYVVYEGQGLYIYNISNPSAAQVLGRYNPSERTYGMTVADDRIYLYNQSLFILRYLDPSLPSFGGVISHANGQPYPGVPVSAGGGMPEKISDMHGAYAFLGVPEGPYTLTPSLPGYVFHPPSRTVSVPPDAYGQNFTILPEPVQLDFTPGISATLAYTDTQRLPTWLDIPGDVSTTPLTLQVVPTVAEASPGYAFTGHAFELNASGAGEGTADFTFDAALTVTIQYSQLDIAVITDPASLALWWWDGVAWQDASKSCSPASEYSRDLENHTLSLQICQSGVYKLLGPTQQVLLPIIHSNK